MHEVTLRYHFGDVIVFDDPITLDNNLHTPPVGRAQGMYLYDRKDYFTAWLGLASHFGSTAPTTRGPLTLSVLIR